MEQLSNLFKIAVPGSILNYTFFISTGGILISLYYFLASMLKKVKFYEKLCLQCIRMSFFAFLIYGIFEIIMFFYSQKLLKYSFKLEEIKNLFLKNIYLLSSVSAILISGLLLFILFLSSKKLIKYKVIYVIFIVIISFLMWGGIYLIIQLKYLYLANEALDVKQLTLYDLFVPKNVSGVFLFWNYLFLSLAIAGAYLVFYLLLRRNKDDFGRDYYKFSVSNSSKWVFSYIFAFIMLCGEIYYFYGEFKLIPQIILLLLGIMLFLIIVSIVLGIKLAHSNLPLRLKEIIIIKPVLGFFICGIFIYILIFEYKDLILGKL